MSAAARVLDRLERVKQTGQDRWIACCPAHDDGSPSLSIRELDDGKVLLKCLGGFVPIQVLHPLGLELSALFTPNSGSDASAVRSRIPARDLLEIISEEASVIAIAAADLLAKKVVTESDWHRLATACARIGRARDHAYGR